MDTTSNWLRYPKGDTWQNDLGHVCLCRHQRGSVDPAGAADAVLSYYRATQRDLIPFLQVDGENINEKHALVTASINKTKLDPSRLIPPAHRRISTSPYSHVESMQRLARSLRTIAVQSV